MIQENIINKIRTHYEEKKPTSLYEIEKTDLALMNIVGMTVPIISKKEIIETIQKHYIELAPSSYKQVDKEDQALMRIAGITIPSRKAKEDLDYLDMVYHDKKSQEVTIDDMKKVIGLKYTYDQM